MNFLSLFILIPILMLGSLALSGNMKQIRSICAAGASLLLFLSVLLTFMYLDARNSGDTTEMPLSCGMHP